MSSHYGPKLFFKSSLETSAIHGRFSWRFFEEYKDHYIWDRRLPTGQILFRLSNSRTTPPTTGSGFFQRYEAIKEKYDD